MTRAETLATALADAMLDGPWEPGALRARCRRALARRPGWIAALVAEVCTAYPRPPADRPRELAAFIALSAALQRAEATRPLPAPVHRFNRATAMVRHPFPTPVLHHVGNLADHLGLTVAELDTLADPSLRARAARGRRGSRTIATNGCRALPARGCSRPRGHGWPRSSAGCSTS